jgi:uncharacterized membrane protein
MRIVLAIVGAFAGATLGGGGSRFFDVLIGAFAGFAIADLSYIRACLRTLDEDLDRLKGSLVRVAHPFATRPGVEESAPDTPVTSPQNPSPPAQDSHVPPDSSHSQALPQMPAPSPPASPRAQVPLRAQVPPRAPAPPRAQISPGARGSSRPEDAIAVAAYAPSSAPAATRKVPPQQPPNFLLDGIRRFVGGGNLLVRSGVIILFFGIAFLLRYVAEHTRVPIEYRLSGVALGAVVLLVLGWRLRASRPGFALSLQGGAVGILYLTVFAAFHLYALLAPVAAFALLTAIAALSALLAVKQNSQSLALLGVTGGFLAPVLASTGNGDHVFLFGYYAVLNAGIVLMAWFKSWRGLNLAGFAFTFGIGTVWGALTYRAADFATTEPFLILFFLFYVGIAVLFTWRQPPRLRGYVDGTLVFGTPLVTFGLQASMLLDRRFALAYSALAMSALYLGLATLLRRRRDDTQRLLIEAFLVLGVVFLTVAAPIALGSRWNAGAWALEGGALVWIGCRQDRLLSRLFGVLLLAAAGFLLADQFGFAGAFPTLPWNAYGAVLLVSGASLASAGSLFVFAQSRRHTESALANLLFCWGVLWWSLGGVAELSHVVAAEDLTAASLAFLSLTACGASLLHRRLPLPAAVAVALAQFPIMLVFALATATAQTHPFEHGGGVAWPVAFVCFYAVLYRHEDSVGSLLAGALHTASAWLLIALSSWETEWLVDFLVHGSRSWPAVAWAIVPAAALAVMAARADIAPGARRVTWPLGRHRDAYVVAALGLAFALAIWSLVTEFSMTGDVAPLPYVPLLNPVDVVQLLVLLVLWRCWRVIRTAPSVIATGIDARAPGFAIAALCFLWLNASLLRTLHQWIGVPWSLSGMLQSTVTQTALSIFWACLALAAMLFATRKSDRPVWFAGGALLAAVIAKLFFVDLSSVGSIERIVSFVGVGVLMLVIGYYSPLPPRSPQRS